MYVADNYGSKWVKSILNWIRHKTLDGVDYDILIIEATLEAGLRRNKTIDLVNEFVETGLLTVTPDRIIKWFNPEFKPSEIIMKSTDKGESKSDKIKRVAQSNKKPRLLDQYKAYCKQLEEIGDEPLSMQKWYDEIKKGDKE